MDIKESYSIGNSPTIVGSLDECHLTCIHQSIADLNINKHIIKGNNLVFHKQQDPANRHDMAAVSALNQVKQSSVSDS